MTERHPDDVTLYTLHADLTAGFADLKAEMRSGFANLTTTLIAGFRILPTRESSEEMVRLLSDLSATETPYFCPHGRPVVSRLSLKEIKRELRRTW